MEPQVQGQTETISYVVRAPSGDGADFMDVKVKIDTHWVFRDGGESSEGEEALGQATEQKLLEPVDTAEGSQSQLRSRVRELERSEARLQRRVERLSARLTRERSNALWAQEQLHALRGALTRQVREQERAAQRQRRLRELVRRQDAALGQQAAALERCGRTQRHQLGLARQQERALRAQVQRLQRDVQRLCRAAGLLLAELDAPGPLMPTRHGPGHPANHRSASPKAERRCPQPARAEPGVCRLRDREGLASGQLFRQLEQLKLLDFSPPGRGGPDLAQLPRSLQDKQRAAPKGQCHRGARAGDRRLEGEAAAATTQEPDPQGCESHRSLQLADGAIAGSPRWASPPGPGSHPWSPRPAQDGSASAVDEFVEEMEACFRQLRRVGRGQEEFPSRVSVASAESWADFSRLAQGREVCFVREGTAQRSSEVQQGDTEDPGTHRVLPGTASMEGCFELDLSRLCPPSTSLEWVRARFHELVSALKTEQSKLWQDNTKLRRDGERSLQQLCALEEEREKDAAALGALRRDRDQLSGALCDCRRELAQALQAVSDLEECGQSSYRRITQLEADSERLRARLSRLRRAASERARACKGAAARLRLGQRELKALVSQLGVSHRELMQDLGAGIEGVMGALRDGHALPGFRMIRDVEREAEAAGAPGSPAGQRLCGRSRSGPSAENDAETRASAAGAHGPRVEDETDRTRGRPDPSSRTESSDCTAQPTAPGTVSEELGAQSSSAHVAGVDDARLEVEEKKLAPAAEDPGTALWRPSTGPRLWRPKADSSSEEDLRLCVRRLHLQVGTLQCQLRDQGTAHYDALRLQDQLRGQLEELQEKHHEALLAVSPLKAKLASLVQKCRERNRLILGLLRELRRHGPAAHQLEESARRLLSDPALAEYTAAFLGSPETGSILDAEDEVEKEEEEEEEEEVVQEQVQEEEEEDEAFLSAQDQLLDPMTNLDLQCPAPEAEGPMGLGAPQR